MQKIVIELSDKIYKGIKEENSIYGINNGLSASITGKVVEAIQNGVPLDSIRAEIESQRKELKDIEKNLIDNGWTLSVPAKDDDMAEYVKNYDNGENVIGIEIALESCSLGVYGYYGIGCIQIVKFEADMPYIQDDLRRMQQLIVEAERDLIKAGIPFRPTYGFSRCLEYNLGKILI